jgi:hypothetical protein
VNADVVEVATGLRLEVSPDRGWEHLAWTMQTEVDCGGISRVK